MPLSSCFCVCVCVNTRWELGPGDSCMSAASLLQGDPKNAHLQQLDGARERLRLFKADVLDRDALATAVVACEGVFHVASPVPADKVLDPEASPGPNSSDNRRIDIGT